MITELPTQTDFEEAGITFLNLAWDSALSIAIKLDSMDQNDYWDGNEISDEYWTAAQTPLSTALSLVQQGTEFLLKGRIASVSPFLLIGGHLSEWPRVWETMDVSFAEFRTIDAQDLIKVHDVVFPNRLPDEFRNRFNNLRRLRNSIIHTIDRRRRVDAKQIMIEILEVFEVLVGKGKWIEFRMKHLLNDHSSVLYSSEHVHPQLVQELTKAIEWLEPSLAQRFFDFNKDQRRYICPQCYCESRDFLTVNTKLAQLRPNHSKSTTIYCIVCQEDITIRRESCLKDGCKGNVLDEDGWCLTCGEH